MVEDFGLKLRDSLANLITAGLLYKINPLLGIFGYPLMVHFNLASKIFTNEGDTKAFGDAFIIEDTTEKLRPRLEDNILVRQPSCHYLR